MFFFHLMGHLMFGAGIVIFLWAVMSIVPMPNSWDDLKKHFRSSVLFCKLLFQVYTYKIIKNSSKIFVITIQSIMCHKLYCFFPSIKLLTPSPPPPSAQYLHNSYLQFNFSKCLREIQQSQQVVLPVGHSLASFKKKLLPWAQLAPLSPPPQIASSSKDSANKSVPGSWTFTTTTK